MPSYVNSAFGTVRLLQKGVPEWLFGKMDLRIGNTYLAVTAVAITSNVATVTVQLINGPLPAVGNLISIINTTTGTGEFNVNRAIITGVTINTSTGAGTITFALTGANVATTTDSGSVIVEPTEVGDTIAAGSSIPCCIQAPEGDSQFTVPFAVTFPTLPTAVTVNLQAAIKNIDSEYTTVVQAAVVAAGAQDVGPFGYVTLQRGYFYRFNISGLTGSGTICAKIGG